MILTKESRRAAALTAVLRFFTGAVDILIFVSLAGLIAVLLTGGWAGRIFESEVAANRPENFGLPLLGLLLIRRVVDIRTPFREIPLPRYSIYFLQSVSAAVERRAAPVLGMLIGVYSAVIGTTACFKHAAFQSHAYDLGIFSQLLWSAAHGFGLRSSILGHHFFGEHFSPILYLLVPGYRLWPSPFNLLILQTIALSLTCIPLYLLAKSELGSRSWGIFFAFLLLCYQPLRNVNMYDFHPVALATPLLMTAFYLLHKHRYAAFGLVLITALACKEVVAEIVFIFGIYAALAQKRRLMGSIVALTGIGLFFLLILVVIPSFREAPYGFVGRYGYLGDDIPSILQTLLTRPLYVLRHTFTAAKMQYIWEVFGPVGFVSFASPAHFLLALPVLIQNLLSQSPAQYSTAFQYTSTLTPFVFVSAVFGAKRIIHGRSGSHITRKKPSSLPVILLLLSLTLAGKSPAWYARKYNPMSPAHKPKRNMLNMIPPGASVSAQDRFVPHLTSRRELYQFPEVKNSDYIILDSAGSIWPLSRPEYFARVSELLHGEYSIASTEGSLLLLKRKN